MNNNDKVLYLSIGAFTAPIICFILNLVINSPFDFPTALKISVFGLGMINGHFLYEFVKRCG